LTLRINKVIGLAIILGLSAVLILFLFPREGQEPSGERADHLENRLEKLRSVPYTAVTEDKVDRKVAGVRVHDRTKAYKGYNIHCSKLHAEVLLTDMLGKVVHRWSYSRREIKNTDHALMLETGDVLVIDNDEGLLRLDWNSNQVWHKKMAAHHEVVRLEDSTFYVLLREETTHRGLDVRFPAILHLSPDGEEIDRWSSREHLESIKQAFDQRSFLDTVLDSLLAEGDSAAVYRTPEDHRPLRKLKTPTKFYDYFHMNTLTLLPDTPLGRKDARFKEGNFLICFRNVNQIAVLEKDTKKILWVWGEGVLEWPHHPTMVPSGNILVFDNGVERKYSKVIELDPLTGEIQWEYRGDPPRSFYSYQRGSAQRLPNGNTLICEGDKGRAFEVTKEKEIVWEWLNPSITKGGRRERVYRFMRLSSESVERLLKNGQSS
jgi:hypothetical protein